MPHFFNGVNVLEYTPHSKSKSINYLFSNSKNFVIDPKVNDLLQVDDDSFKVAMSIDYFQDTPEYLDCLKSMHRVSSKFVMFSCSAAGKSVKYPSGYYKNLVMSDFYNHLDLGLMFETYRFEVDYSESKLYFWAVKKINSEV